MFPEGSRLSSDFRATNRRHVPSPRGGSQQPERHLPLATLLACRDGGAQQNGIHSSQFEGWVFLATSKQCEQRSLFFGLGEEPQCSPEPEIRTEIGNKGQLHTNESIGNPI